MEFTFETLPRKFMRGQVWIVTEDERITSVKIENGDRTQCKTRPYVVVSAQPLLDAGDFLIHCIPITSMTGNAKEDEIIFSLRGGEQNKICCRNIQTRDSKDFATYRYTMPDEVMMAISETISRRLGITPYPAGKISNPPEEISCPEPEAEEIVADTDTPQQSSHQQGDLQDKLDSRRVWTASYASTVLIDYKSMSKADFKTKYNITKDGDYYNIGYKARKTITPSQLKHK